MWIVVDWTILYGFKCTYFFKAFLFVRVWLVSFNRHIRSHLKKVSLIGRHSKLSICLTFEEYRKHCHDLIKGFVEKGYNKSTARKQIERLDHLDRSLFLKQCKSKRKHSISFSVTYNPVLLNIKEIINKHWYILSANSSFKETFNNIQPMIAFCKNTSLK